MCRSRRELSNGYFLAKFGRDTAENEPCQVCPIGDSTLELEGGEELPWAERPPAALFAVYSAGREVRAGLTFNWNVEPSTKCIYVFL